MQIIQAFSFRNLREPWTDHNKFSGTVLFTNVTWRLDASKHTHRLAKEHEICMTWSNSEIKPFVHLNCTYFDPILLFSGFFKYGIRFIFTFASVCKMRLDVGLDRRRDVPHRAGIIEPRQVRSFYYRTHFLGLLNCEPIPTH